jgi:hypothetical protein
VTISLVIFAPGVFVAMTKDDTPKADGRDREKWVCAVERRCFPVGERPTRQVPLPEATGATVEVTKRLKPSGNACHELR